MDPSIMKLLEDDEDETMHSGADVDALSAALNRDIAGDASAFSQPSDPESGALSQGSVSQQPSGKWPISNQDENVSQKIQSIEEQPSGQHSSKKEPTLSGSGDKDQDQPSGTEPKNYQLQMQQEHPHSDQQLAETNPHSLEKDQSKITDKTQVTSQAPYQFPKQESNQHSETQQQHTYQQLNAQQQTTDSNDVNNSAKRTKAAPSIPFQLLMPLIRPFLDKDRAMQLQAVFAKLRSNEVTKEDFLRVIRNIVGDQMLRQAVNKVQMQLQSQAARNPQTNSNQYSLQTQASSQQLLSRGPHQFSEPQSSPPPTSTSTSQNQKGRRSPSRQSQIPASTALLHTNFENTNHKSQDMENKPNGKGMQASQTYSTSMNTINPEREVSMTSSQAINKQQQHMQLPQSSYSMYGAGSSNFHSHPYTRPPISHMSTAPKSQTLDSHIRQASHTQGLISTQIGSIQPNNAKMQNMSNETKRLHGGSLTGHLASQQNPVTWPPFANKEQRSAVPMTHVKQEVVNQASEPPQKSQLTDTEGSSFGSGQIDRSKPTMGSFKNEGIEKQSSRMGFPTSSSSIGGHMPGLATTQMDTAMQSQISSATPSLVPGAATRTPPKKPSVGQKKPFEAINSSSPQSSKKQKVSGAFHDQSIEHLNDVTAVSGVNLREEEEQLLSAPKEDSRASEATRRVVQEEEEKLILQKAPLQKKLANIMSDYGLKAISSDVERCLSLCVEERLRGLISSLIRLSKQRVDIEKARHRVVITSDVGRQILAMNKKAKEEWDKKQAEEAEKLRKLNETEDNTGGDVDKDKDDEANKEEDDKMRTTAANVAARAAVGGDDMLSKWQLMAEQARQKREGLDGASSSQPAKATSHKPLPSLKRSSREQQKTDKKGPSSSFGGNRKFGRSPAVAQPKVKRSICTKDVIAVLEREPQMSKSTLIYRLYEKLAGDSAVE